MTPVPDADAIYLKQLELGPMQNFVYLVGDPVARECVVVDPAWEIDTIVDTVKVAVCARPMRVRCRYRLSQRRSSSSESFDR